MYAEIYPHLYAKYKYDNFEMIMGALDKHFCDLFQLNVLENEAKTGFADGSYTQLFDACMTQLKELYTPEEVVKKLAEVLQQTKIQEKFTSQYLFVPPIGPQASKQVSFLEKAAMDQFKVAEPLSSIDMLRVVQGLRSLKEKHSLKAASVEVVQLNHLNVSGALDIKALLKKDALMVNFNRDLKGTPKWGVVDLRNSHDPQVYCETPLTEREKDELQKGLGKKFTFIGATANSLPSTGYMALAWLDNNITKAWNFDVSADFTSLFKDFVLTYFGGDNKGNPFIFTAKEREKYCTPAFREVLKIKSFYGKEHPEDVTHPGFPLARASWLAGLGELKGVSYRQGDFCAAVRVWGDPSQNFDYTDVELDLYKFNRTLLPGFAATLSKHPGLVTEETDSIKLHVPKNLNIEALGHTHQVECGKTNTSSGWFDSSYEKLKNLRIGNQEEFYATMLVLALVRAKSKKREISIDLPAKYQLNKDEQGFMVGALLENPYVTELKLLTTNISLDKVKAELIPTFARNRWLAASGYRPPLVDNYWRQAARYWLIHLHDAHDLLQPKQEHDLFKRCVLEMGLTGVKEVLGFLTDETEREFIENIYGRDKPVFYAACSPSEYREYFNLLLKHLQAESYFPFSELGISYQSGNDKQLISIVDEINKLESFEKITFTDCLKDKLACKEFLSALVKKAEKEQWVGLIVIPELEDKNNMQSSMRELRLMYTLLNDMILRNRHLKAAAEKLKRIQEISDFSMPDTEKHEIQVTKKDKEPASSGEEELTHTIERAIGTLDEKAKWPLKKGGAVQLQLQQQQQIEQVRQIQQEQQKVVINTIEEAIAGELVDYNNVDKLLNKFFKNFQEENPVVEKAATLKDESETLLQGFFHTWINANPKVPATHVIQQMTLEAAQALLRKHTRLTSGLNPENLPKGFYTQRSKDGNLILCYSPELSYVSAPTALTLDLNVRVPVAEAWEGDFRQFNLKKYEVISTKFDMEDWQNILLFAKMQPAKESYADDFETFLFKNPLLSKELTGNKKKIINFWPIFLQTWQYAGAEGVAQFIKYPYCDEPVNTVKEYLLAKLTSASPQLREWANEIDMDESYLRALGQVYYRYGDSGLTLFLSKLRQIEAVLGKEFFASLNANLLSKSANFNCFMTENFFITMDDMMIKLRSHEAAGKKLAWQGMMKKHLDSVGWENIDVLWRGFDHFSSELTQMGVELEGNEFDNVKPENMLAQMDRILASLNHIPDIDMQQLFMENLADLDLTNGGVHYALQYEGFKYFGGELKLYDFTSGSPAYAPDLAALYKWSGGDATLKMKRTLASQAQFSQVVYKILLEHLGNDTLMARHQLMWLLHTQYDTTNMPAVLGQLQTINSDFMTLIARHLHQAVYSLGNKQLAIELNAVEALEKLPQQEEVLHLLKKYPQGTFLEAASILYQSKRWNDAETNKLINLFNSSFEKAKDYPDYLFFEGLKLATLFGVTSPDLLEKFYNETTGIRPIVQNEIRLLINQVLSVNYATSDLSALVHSENWDLLLECIVAMKKDPANSAVQRIAFIEKLNAKNIEFKYSKSGEFRVAKAEEKPVELGFFVDHEDRLWSFIQKHILVSVHTDAKESLMPIVRFLKKLQLNRTYLNEIEPLLSSLEQAKEGRYWSASYFHQLLRALQPDNDQISFPISLLKVMLQEEIIAPKPIDSVEKDFPVALIEPLQIILKNTMFNRHQQALLCQIAFREYNWQGSVSLLNQIMGILAAEVNAESISYALKILAKSSNYPELEARFENCRWLVQHSPASQVAAQWNQVTELWLQALSERKQEETLFAKIKAQFETNPEKLSLILHIVAFSSLRPGLRDNETWLYELTKQTPKLVDKLAEMDLADLRHLAHAYPQQPSPATDDILRLIKKQKQKGISWEEGFDAFTRQPFSEPRADYGTVAATRDADLQRMISETRVSADVARQGLTAHQSAQLTLIFSYLKRLESGEEYLKGSKKVISVMNQEELAKAFHSLSKMVPQDDLTRAQIWAVLFEVLGRTSRKYPHLAQQFALIANDITVDSPTRVLQLATGEGKSHFVAMRAVRHAGQGKKVNVLTAKRTLAERDLADYQSLYDYLGIKTSYIHPKSAHATYEHSQVHYSTLGDLSLFLDEQSYSGQPIEIDPQERVGLFDEFDFIRFEEGRKTEYNYARPTGKTPKQMTWFYQAVNAFYTSHQEELTDAREIGVDTLREFANSLQKNAGDNEERQNLISQLLRDPLQLVQWLQSAHEAHTLEWGVGFTVREENIEVGDESYPMREVIPLSSDNQKMIGSTFSAGVHQLLAVRLNTEAQLNKKPQDFHIHPESNIISSQIAAQLMKVLWRNWEGFSGTISAAQAATLNREFGTNVLHVPTNQRDLRFWHKPTFYSKPDDRLNALVKQIKQCVENKQSVLFSCKNDKQVQELQEQLSKKFTAEELQQNFIFYTNEEHRSASEVLDDKTAKENWHGGKKQHAVNLVASGFGRGDNVGVEAVFLFDVNDTNDKLQKGGRTARNGAEGQVFQFYLNNELIAEEKSLWDVLKISLPKEVANLEKQLSAVLGDSDEEKRFERIMLLREYVFSLQNAANQGYHSTIAQLSSWGMKNLGQIEDPAERKELTTNFSFMLKRLDKSWIDISSQDKLDIDEKINKIEEQIARMAAEFSERCAKSETELSEFQLAPRQRTLIQLVVPQATKAATSSERAIASICSVLSQLPDLSLQDQESSSIPEQLQRLSVNAEKLQEFAKRISTCVSTTEFINKLQIAVKQVEKPSVVWTELETVASTKIDHEALFKDVSDSVRIRCSQALNGLVPSLQDKAIEYLGDKSLVSAESRINEMVPILEYLGKFTAMQQENWGAEYIDKMKTLIHQHEKKTGLLDVRLHAASPMHYSHFKVIGDLVLNKVPSNNNAELLELLDRLEKAIAAEPEQRLRMLTKCETWIKFLPKNQVKPFMMTFCHVMEHFKEGENWDTFLTLVRKTQDWWNKGGEGAYIPGLMNLWERLAKHVADLPQLNEFLQWSMKLGGKNWFQLLNNVLDVLPADKFAVHLNQLKNFWDFYDEQNIKSSERMQHFNQCCVAIRQFYKAISVVDTKKQAKAAQDLLALDKEQFVHMIDVISEAQTLTSTQSPVFVAMLNYLNDPSISLARSKLLSRVILQVAHYQESHAHLDINHLLGAIERFKGCNEQTLELLLQLMEKNEVHDHTLEPLFDNTVFYLEKNIAPSARKNVQQMIHTFYKVAKEQRGNPDEMFALPEVKRLFDFEDKSMKHRSQRITWMHLLQQQVFVTVKVHATDQHDYFWENKANERFTQLGLDQYIGHTKKILDEHPATANVHNKRDLTIKQQNHLLQLTDELNAMGTPRLRAPLDPAERKLQATHLNQNLNKLMQGYQASWFKSQKRKDQIEYMQDNIQRLFAGGGAGPRYAEVMRAISAAKFLAIEEDALANKNRWFKMNRSGQSRYFNTLNQMQDLVVRHWSQDLHELHDFKAYNSYNQRDFMRLVNVLQDELTEHYDVHYPTPANPRYHELNHRLSRFFGNVKSRQSLEDLSTALANFTEGRESGAEITAEQVNELMNELRKGLGTLPGNLATLANEVLIRGDSLELNLGEKAGMREIKDTFRGPSTL